MAWIDKGLRVQEKISMNINKHSKDFPSRTSPVLDSVADEQQQPSWRWDGKA